MSALTVVEPDDLAVAAPVGYVGDGWVEADNVRSHEAQLIAAADQLASPRRSARCVSRRSTLASPFGP